MAKQTFVPVTFPVFEVKGGAGDQTAAYLDPMLESWEKEGWRFVRFESLTVPKMIKSSMISTDQGAVSVVLALIERD